MHIRQYQEFTQRLIEIAVREKIVFLQTLLKKYIAKEKCNKQVSHSHSSKLGKSYK